MSRWVTIIEQNGYRRKVTRHQALQIMQEPGRSYEHGGWLADGGECLTARADMTYWNGSTSPRNTHGPGEVRS